MDKQNALFINNHFVPLSNGRPHQVKIEEMDADSAQEKIFYSTTVDSFDSVLYEKCLKLKNNKNTTEKNYDMIFKFSTSQNLHALIYHENLGVENFDSLSNRKPFVSVPSMGNMTLRSKYKLQLAKIYRNDRKKYEKKNFVEIMLNDDVPDKNQTRDSKSIFNDFHTNEKEKKFFESALVRRGTFHPTHTAKTSEISKNRISVNLKEIVNKENKKKYIYLFRIL
jgi:Icc-related predicted phosphoesterase